MAKDFWVDQVFDQVKAGIDGWGQFIVHSRVSMLWLRRVGLVHYQWL
jgi:hypothetical protein